MEETMKNYLKTAAITLLLLLTTGIIARRAILRGEPAKMPFYVYKDHVHANNHYIPSGFMGDIKDIKVKSDVRKRPQSGDSCMRVTYSAACSNGKQWSGVYWQNPANNWGNIKGGYDLGKAERFVFWARGRKGGESVEFKIGGIRGRYSDTGSETTGVVTLTKKWKKFSIDLDDMLATYISGGFCVIFTKTGNPRGAKIYLDEIRYE